MGLVLKRVADGEWRVFWDGQSIGGSKLRANVATRIAFDQGMIFKPQKEPFFELATEWLPDSRACFEARNPSMPMERPAMREQINAFDVLQAHHHLSGEPADGVGQPGDEHQDANHDQRQICTLFTLFRSTYY